VVHRRGARADGPGRDPGAGLLDGDIYVQGYVSPPHAATSTRLLSSIIPAVDGRVVVRARSPLRLPPHSEPAPDVLVARHRRDHYQWAHPTAEDTLLAIEVVDTSIDIDRAIKIPIYARQYIVEVWIVDLTEDVVHVYTEPVDGAYLNVRTLRLGDVLVPMINAWAHTAASHTRPRTETPIMLPRPRAAASVAGRSHGPRARRRDPHVVHHLPRTSSGHSLRWVGTRPASDQAMKRRSTPTASVIRRVSTCSSRVWARLGSPGP
jgi:Putative restriction endonuclease